MLEVNGRRYRLPTTKVALICLDGSDPDYLNDYARLRLAARAGQLCAAPALAPDDDAPAGQLCAAPALALPTFSRWRRDGFFAIGAAQVPTFTNPNNVSIVTGVPASIHGISGNFFLDPEDGAEVPMNEPRFLRVPTILSALAGAGVSVGVATAKKKLLDLLRPAGGRFAISVEVPSEEARRLAGRTPPAVYSADASLFVLDAGAAALEQGAADLVYLSTTDYVQHKHPPRSAEARSFYAEVDRRLARLEATGAIVALTADHGMNDKTRPDGSPNVVWLEALLEAAIGPGARVTLPITDPYVAHHGSLGSCAMIHLFGGSADAARRAIAGAPGVEAVLSKDEAAEHHQLPRDRIGDLMVLADRHTALGKRPEAHDLSQVELGLRSHGGLGEVAVPIFLSRPLRTPAPAPLRNFDLFDLALNHV